MEKTYKKTRRKQLKKKKYLTKQQMDKFLKVVERVKNIRDIALFNLGYYLGLRINEIGLLKIADYNPHTNSIYITRLKGSESGVRRLDQKRGLYLRRYLKLREYAMPYDPIFISNQGRAISDKRIHQLMKIYGEKAKLPADIQVFKALKHSIAIHLGESGIDIKEIQWMLGHVDVKNTLEYFRFTTIQQDQFYRKIEKSNFIS
jgi:site-specific recombinase XerD